MKKLTFAFCVLTLGSSMAYAADTDIDTEELVGDPVAGKARAATCIACHGADGNAGLNPLWPKLAGQHTGYLVKQLKDFHVKEREDPSMTAMAAPLTDQDIYNLAAFFADQPRTKGTPVDKSLVGAGQKIYRGGNKENKLTACIACHGPNGLGNPVAQYPAIAGQPAAYSKKQLMDFRTGARKLRGNAITMHDVAIRMSIDEMDAVTNYIQGM